MSQTESPLRVVHTVCSHDCPDSCAVLVSVDAGGRAQKIAGDPSHPVTRGFLCGVAAIRSPTRPIGCSSCAVARRRRPAAPDAPKPSPWDEALDTIAERLPRSAGCTPRIHPALLLRGTIGVLGYGSMDRRFFHRLGASQLDRTICATAGGDAFLSVYGRKLGTDTEQFHARV
jgi:anaerobic selenocysteine-containing dehydrogenase